MCEGECDCVTAAEVTECVRGDVLCNIQWFSYIVPCISGWS